MYGALNIGRLPRLPADDHEVRWACSTAATTAGECLQDVTYDENAPTLWENAAPSEFECYQRASDSGCERYSCSSEVPYSCSKVTSTFAGTPTGGFLKSATCDDSCTKYVPKYQCNNGKCVEDANGEYETVANCQDKCRSFNVVYDDKTRSVGCKAGDKYGEAGTDSETCETIKQKTKYSCGSFINKSTGKPEKMCIPNVLYGTKAYSSSDAYETQEECSTICKLTGARCDPDTNQCVQDRSENPEFESMVNCTMDSETCGGFACSNDGNCEAANPFKNKNAFASKLACTNSTACGVHYVCDEKTKSCQQAAEGLSYVDCLKTCNANEETYACNEIYGQCIYNPAAPGTKSTMAKCEADCKQSSYMCENGQCRVADPSTEQGTSALDCLTECGFASPESDAYMFPPTTNNLFDVDDAGFYISNVLAWGVNLMSGEVALNSLADHKPTIHELIGVENRMYTADPKRQRTLLGRRFYNSDAVTNYFERISTYEKNISTETHVSGSFTYAGFTCSTQVDVELNQSFASSSKVRTARFRYSIDDGVMELNLKYFENWQSMIPTTQKKIAACYNDVLNGVQSSNDAVETLLNVVGSHVVSRLYIGKRITNSTYTEESSKLSSRQLSIAACVKVDYASSFSSSVCNSTEQSSSAAFSKAATNAKTTIDGGDKYEEMITGNSSSSSIQFLMWANSAPSSSTVTKYEYINMYHLLANMGRLTTDTSTRVMLTTVSKMIQEYMINWGKTITSAWEKHGMGTHAENLPWPKSYTRWKRFVSQPRPLRALSQKGDVTTTYNCDNHECMEVDGDYGTYSTLDECEHVCWGYECDLGFCTQVSGGTKTYDDCLLNTTCSKYKCKYGPNISCEFDPLGKPFAGEEACEADCTIFKGTPAVCPEGKMCYGNGHLVSVIGNNLLNPSNPRKFFKDEVLAYDSKCTSSQFHGTSPAYGSQTKSSAQDMFDSFKNTTKVEASYTSGNTNVSATASVAVGENTENHTSSQSKSYYYEEPRATYGYKSMDGTDYYFCSRLDAIEIDVLYAMLGLPPVPSAGTNGAELVEYDTFVTTYGSHIITNVTLGVSVMDMLSTTSESSMAEHTLEVSACVAGNGDGWNAEACSGYASDTKETDSSMAMNTRRSVVGGNGVLRAITVDPTNPNSTMYMGRLADEVEYIQPIGESAYEYTSVWEKLINMRNIVTYDEGEMATNGSVWLQIMNKSWALCLAYVSRWCLTDIVVQEAHPESSVGAVWVKVRMFGCSQVVDGYGPHDKPDYLNANKYHFDYDELACVGAGNVFFKGEEGDHPYSHNPFVATVTKADGSRYDGVECGNVLGLHFDPNNPNQVNHVPQGCGGYMWAKWELLCMPKSDRKVITAFHSEKHDIDTLGNEDCAYYDQRTITAPSTYKGAFRKLVLNGSYDSSNRKDAEKAGWWFSAALFNDTAKDVVAGTNTYGNKHKFVSSLSMGIGQNISHFVSDKDSSWPEMPDGASTTWDDAKDWFEKKKFGCYDVRGQALDMQFVFRTFSNMGQYTKSVIGVYAGFETASVEEYSMMATTENAINKLKNTSSAQKSLIVGQTFDITKVWSVLTDTPQASTMKMQVESDSQVIIGPSSLAWTQRHGIEQWWTDLALNFRVTGLPSVLEPNYYSAVTFMLYRDAQYHYDLIATTIESKRHESIVDRVPPVFVESVINATCAKIQW